MELPAPSCPQGYTLNDLKEIFGDDSLPAFSRWMNGQTMSLCNGRSYRYNRIHTGKCELDKPDCAPAWSGLTDHDCITHCGHDEGDPFAWFCGYAGGGIEVATQCGGNPHGLITYRHDVERYIESIRTGRPAIWD